ncbi:LPS export ABC transporter periplasmic protein LptC [Sediminicoccus sp. KRV36]|uniref:LPS export ABC transporter periplasmic protein LptC n=1 Tax=Sediminicoccus sp. KRV36 TaxID=3133721 RepID=UPI00200EBAE1|nr:LPS export ABC transporter periplasmic protein LptC [Sediminicoccus rosea]UPY38624.1 LPS export ABC transporter periplasmic protein LptC [Sediminicoccus rosea]
MSDKVRRTDFRETSPDRRRVLTPSRERRVPSRGQIQRRQRLVQAMKLVMPLLAASVLGLLVFWPEIEGRDSRLSFRRGPSLTPEALQLVAPRFQGVDELNRPYTITSRSARQPGQEEVMLLDLPKADILMTDGTWVYVESNHGRYDKAAQHLDLSGDVRLFHDGGILFRTEEAAVQVDAGTASGDRPTKVQGSFGTVESEGFELLDRGAVMIFTGRARAILEGRQQ